MPQQRLGLFDDALDNYGGWRNVMDQRTRFASDRAGHVKVAALTGGSIFTSHVPRNVLKVLVADAVTVEPVSTLKFPAKENIQGISLNPVL